MNRLLLMSLLFLFIFSCNNIREQTTDKTSNIDRCVVYYCSTPSWLIFRIGSVSPADFTKYRVYDRVLIINSGVPELYRLLERADSSCHARSNTNLGRYNSKQYIDTYYVAVFENAQGADTLALGHTRHFPLSFKQMEFCDSVLFDYFIDFLKRNDSTWAKSYDEYYYYDDYQFVKKEEYEGIMKH